VYIHAIIVISNLKPLIFVFYCTAYRLTLFISIATFSFLPSAGDSEADLYKFLMTDYTSFIRPAQSVDESVHVDFVLGLKKIVDLVSYRFEFIL
jgi:hypothetical protein